MKIYTKTGDDGSTGLFGGTRVSKTNLRVATYGDIDELNAHLGVVRAVIQAADVDVLLDEIQRTLFEIGAELASAGARPEKAAAPVLDAEDVHALELAIDKYEEELAPLRTFVLPGGVSAAAHLHVARAVCRRAERTLVALAGAEPVRDAVLQYVNRLSDLLFVLARVMNSRAGQPDVPWQSRTRDSA